MHSIPSFTARHTARHTTRHLVAIAAWALGSLVASTSFAADPMDVEKAPPPAAGMKVPATTVNLFNKIDKDQDGKLSKEEAKTLPGVAERFDELDKNKDGYLSLDEFNSAIKPDAAK